MKRLAVLGSTGSIGTSTLDLVRLHPDRFRVITLAAGRNVDLLRRQIVEFGPSMVSIGSSHEVEALSAEFPAVSFVTGADGLDATACHPEVEMVVSALVGAAGLAPTVAAIRSGKDIALANKETLVIAGELVLAEATRAGISLLPVDSEHSALHQILRGAIATDVARLTLTASRTVSSEVCDTSTSIPSVFMAPTTFFPKEESPPCRGASYAASAQSVVSLCVRVM